MRPPAGGAGRHRGGEEHASVTVEDAGPGIPADVLPRLFEPYSRPRRTASGVGLSISRSIVESHGGSIAASNVPQGGARFTVILPAD